VVEWFIRALHITTKQTCAIDLTIAAKRLLRYLDHKESDTRTLCYKLITGGPQSASRRFIPEVDDCR